MLRFMNAVLILLSLTTVTVVAQSPAVSVAVTPSTVIVVNEEITFTATARTANPNCTLVAFSYTLLSSPIPATGFPPVFGSSAQATTTVDRITVAGLYVFQLTVTDNCQAPPATTTLPLNVRALGGTYDTAVVRVAVDAAGTFNWNGLAPSGVTGFMDGQTLTVSVPNVAPGDVFSIIGKNLPTATAPNPAMVAATIRWRDMDFNTSPTTWQCTNGNLTQTNGNNNWMMKPGNNPVPAAVSQGTNAPGSVWAALNNNKILGGVAPEAQFLWTQSTLNFPAADASIVSCRSVFTPPPEIVTGLVIVSSVPTVPPTLPPTLPPTTAPTIPPTTATQPTTPPTVLPTTLAPTTATPVAGAGQNGAATTTTGGGTKLNPLFIVIPVVIVAAIIALIWIIRQRRKSLTPTPISKLSEMV